MLDAATKKNDEFDDKQGISTQSSDNLTAYHEDLPVLTPMQSAYVNNVLKGMSYTDAYQSAYNTDNQAMTTIWTRSSELNRNSAISLWLSRAREEGAIFQACTYANSLNRLANLSDGAEKAGQYSAAVKAEEARGKLEGLYVDRVEQVGVTEAEVALLALTKALGPVAARGIAASLGIIIKSDKPLIEGETQP